MNRLGIMVDVSHVSDDAFWDVLDTSTAPVIASHSSCRHFTPGWERNMSDDMIRALAGKGGVIQINFGSGFLDADVRKKRDARRAEIEAMLRKRGIGEDDPEAMPLVAAYEAEHPSPVASVRTVADHIDHVVQLVGVDHVGLGSDFDGVGDSLPDRLEDVSMYPNLIAELLDRGYAEPDIEKICSKNVLRVWRAVAATASKAAG
jgi:membrane dipeptidase